MRPTGRGATREATRAGFRSSGPSARRARSRTSPGRPKARSWRSTASTWIRGTSSRSTARISTGGTTGAASIRATRRSATARAISSRSGRRKGSYAWESTKTGWHAATAARGSRRATTSRSPMGTYSLSISATNGSVTTTVACQLTIADRAVRTFVRGDGGPFSETDDLYISDGSPNTNFGSDVNLLIDAVDCNPPGGVCKSLIKFPSIVGPASGQIPAGSRIVDASLRLRITNDGKTQTAYQVTEGWDEATATWNGFHTPGVPGNRGAEFTFAPNPVGPLSLNITSIVQRWANGEANQGILLSSTHGNGVDYNASESVRDRPILKVQFVPPPSPLVLAYDMETLTSDGKMKDLSGNRRDGLLSGTAAVAGKLGNARRFSGNGDRITASPLPVSGLDF